MKYIAISIIYAAYFGMIAFAIYWTSSAWPLLGLLLSPTIKSKK
jgi:hypothetical protein